MLIIERMDSPNPANARAMSAPARTASTDDPTTVRLVGGPTALIETGGLRFLTDPAFDLPAVPAEEIGPVDVVPLSHDQHPDHLDDAGREVIGSAPLVLSTPDAAERLGGRRPGGRQPSRGRAAVTPPR